MIPNSVYDFFGNTYIGNIHGPAIMLYNYTQDTHMPYILAITLDLNTNILILTYNEPINLLKFRVSDILMTSSLNIDSGTEVFKFSNYTIIQTDNNYYNIIVNFGLYSYDNINIQNTTYIGKGINTTYITIYNSVDLFNNRLVQTSLQITNIIYNIQNIRLIAFDYIPYSKLSIPEPYPYTSILPTQSVFTLYYNTIINIHTFTCNSIILYSNPSIQPVTHIQLNDTDCNIITYTNSNIISIFVNNTVFTTLVSVLDGEEYIWLGTSDTTSPTILHSGTSSNTTSSHYLSSPSTTGQLIPIPSTNPLRNGPELLSYTIDMNAGILILLFIYTTLFIFIRTFIYTYSI